MATTATVTTDLPGIVNEIRTLSYQYYTQTGVMRRLVTPQTGVGYQLVEPYLDPTQVSTAAATEGTEAAATTVISATRRTYTASERYTWTKLTDRSEKESQESVKAFHSESHGYAHAAYVETQLLGCLASGTSTVTATSATGLTWAKLAAARTLLEAPAASATRPAPKPYSLVISPAQWYWFAKQLTPTSTIPVAAGSISDQVQQKYHVTSLIGGVDVYQSSYFTASATGYQKAGMFSKAAIGLFVPNGLDYTLEAQRNAKLRGFELVGTTTFGARIRVPSYCVTVAATSTTPS